MTTRYASPEQIRREKDIAVPSDVYSLGVVLYELIAGRSPYGGADHELADRILSGSPLGLFEAPRDLDAVVRKALRKTPSERYQSVDDFQDDLTRFVEGRPVSARGKGAPYRAGKFLRKRWQPIGSFATIAILLAVFLVPAPSKRPAILALEASEGAPLAFSFSPDARRLYYLAGNVFFNYSDLFVKDLETGKSAQITTDGVFKLQPAVSPDGKNVAFLRAAGLQTMTLAMVPSGGGPERKLFTAPAENFSWDADSKSLIVSHRSDEGIWPHLRGFNIETSEWWQITDPPKTGRGDHYSALSPDGKILCFVRQEARESADLFLLTVDEKLRPVGTPRRLTSRRLRIAFPQWTPDGKEIVYASGTLGDFRAFRVAVDGRSEPAEILGAGGGVQALAIAARARRLVVGRSQTESNIWRLDFQPAPPVLTKLPASTGKEDGVTFSPDGKEITFVSNRSGEPQVWVARADGTGARQITFYSAPDMISPLWLPDSSGLLVSLRSRAVGLKHFIVKLPSGTENELAGIVGTPSTFSHDGKWLYFSLIGKDVDIYKYSMATGQVVQITHEARGSYAAESPDGSTVYFSKPEADLGLWKIDSAGGAPQQVLPNLARRTLFGVRDEGIYYIERQARSAVLKLRRFSDGRDIEFYRTRTIPNWGFSLTRDAHSLLFNQEDLVTSEVLLFNDLR